MSEDVFKIRIFFKNVSFWKRYGLQKINKWVFGKIEIIHGIFENKPDLK